MDSIKKCREASVQRAFQSLPRYLRRRAASHNVKRVPKRVRARALAELGADDLKKQHKRVPFGRKRGRRATIRKLALLRKDDPLLREPARTRPPLVQGTDLDSVKPLTTGKFVHRQRNKTWLPSHLWTCKRAKMETRWNYSIPVSPNEKTYRSTHRAATSKGAIVFDTSYTGTILLKGNTQQLTQLVQELTVTKETCGARARNGRKAIDCHVSDDDYILCPATILWSAVSLDDETSVLVRIHPASFADVWKLLLKLRKQGNLDLVKIIDMRFQIGSIEVFGPASIDVVISVLKSAVDTETAKAWRSLHGLRPTEIPQNLIVPLTVRDPRLGFPPQPITEAPKIQNKYLFNWPVLDIGSPLFSLDETESFNVSRPEVSETSKCEASNLPVLLRGSNLGVSIMAPWAYITDIWYSLNHLPLVRFGGLQEFSQIHYENSLPFFPNDYPGTRAGDLYAKEFRDQSEATYLRKPPAKRTSFAKSLNGKVEVGDPFTSDFSFLFHGLPSGSQGDLSHVSASLLERSKANDTTVDVTMEDAVLDISTGPLYTSTPQIPPALESSIKSAPKQSVSQEQSGPVVDAQVSTDATAASVNKVVPRLLIFSKLSETPTSSLDRGLVQVKIRLTKRGCPKKCARIYQCLDRDRVGDLIGFLTTGNFSLSEGRATGIGSILAHIGVQSMLKYDKKASNGQRQPFGECFVRDVGTGNFRKAIWETLVSK